MHGEQHLRKVVLSKIKKRLGLNECKFGLTGAALVGMCRPGVASALFALAPQLAIHMGVFSAWFFDRPGIVDVWGLGGPGGRENPSKRLGESRPTFWKACSVRRVRPDPQTFSISG